MKQRNTVWAMGAMLVALGFTSVTGGCKSTHEKVTYPDGTIHERQDVEFRPNFFPSLLNYEMREKGLSQEGLRLREWIPKKGGETIHEVEGVYYVPLKKPRGTPPRLTVNSNYKNEEVQENVAPSEYRISADYLADSAVLEGQIVGTDNWQTIIDGDVQDIAIATMKRGLGAMEFENEFGSWRIVVDAPIPVIVTRLNGEIMDVRGINVRFGSYVYSDSVNENCR
jgi:hypothetical protein